MHKAMWINLYHFDTMAMRPRRGGGVGSRRGTRPGVVRPVYEDFKPVSEWQQDDESHILIIYLPGFMKEQIKITTEGRNTIRVSGERLVAGNKWSRFSEDFQVPENGEMNSVSAKFQGGVLTISVPKEAALPPQNTDISDIRKQPTPQKPGRAKATSDIKGRAEIRKQPETLKSRAKAVQEVKGGGDGQSFAADIKTKSGQAGKEKSLDKPLPEVGTSQSTAEKSLDPVKANNKRNTGNEEGSSENQRGRSFTPTRNVISQNVEKKDVASKKPEDTTKENVHKERRETMGGSRLPEVKTTNKESEKSGAIGIPEKIAEKDSEDTTKENVHKERRETMGGLKLPEVETTNKESEKSGAIGIPEKIAKKKDSDGALKQQNYKKAVKGLTGLNEERQLLVNMGVAVLVIVALTAYVTHSFACAKHKN